MKEITYEIVEAALSKNYVCRMPKEDRRIYPKRCRSLDVEQVMNEICKNAQINVIKYKFEY